MHIIIQYELWELIQFCLNYRIWKGFGSTCMNTSFNLSESMVAYLPLEDKINAIDAIHSTDGIIKVAIGTASGEVHIWLLAMSDPTNVSTAETVDIKLVLNHDDEVTGINFNESGTKIVSCGLDKYLYVCDVETGMILFRKEHMNSLICMNWSMYDETLYLGDNEGTIHVWNMTIGEKKCDLCAFNGPITSITSRMYNNKRMIVAAGVDYHEFVVKSFKTD